MVNVSNFAQNLMTPRQKSKRTYDLIPRMWHDSFYEFIEIFEVKKGLGMESGHQKLV